MKKYRMFHERKIFPFWLSKTFRIIKISLILLFTGVISIYADNSYSQEAKLSIDKRETTVGDILLDIENQSEFFFLFSNKLVDVNRKVNITAKNTAIGPILDHLFASTDIRYVVNDRQIILSPEKMLDQTIKNLNIKAQGHEISGTVTDSEGQPLPGVTIMVEGTTTGTISDAEGKFQLEVPVSTENLHFSFVGMKAQVVNIAGKTQVSVVMEEDNVGLEEVVVTALGITRKKVSLGYSTTSLTGDQVATAKESNVINSLAGKVAGVVITPASSGMGGSSRVIIRGNASITGNNQPLYVVDGIPINNSGFGTTNNMGKGIGRGTDYGSGISDINADDIASITVLKGPNAAALYGARAANGVIMITTKKGSRTKGVGITYTANVMWNNALESTLPQFQNEYGQGSNGVFDPAEIKENWGSKFDGSPYQTVRGVDKTYTAQPDNVMNYLETGMEVVNTIAIDGGSENASVRFSYTNFAGKAIVPNGSLNKHNFNLRTTANLTDKLSLDAKATYFIQNGSHRPVMGWALENNMVDNFRMPRNGEIEDYEDYGDEFTGTINPYSVNPWVNPYWIQYKNTDEDYRRRIQGYAKATYKFNEAFTAFARIGTDALTQKIATIVPTGYYKFPKGYRNDNIYGITETNADFLVMFNKTYGNFSINLNAGGNYKYAVNEVNSMGGKDFKLPTSTIYSNLEEKTGNEYKHRSSVYSLYFSGEIGFKEMAYLSFSGRNDWDSGMWTKSGSSSDYSFFYPSIGISLLGNKMFGIDNSFMSFSKLRISYAGVGSGGYKSDETNYYMTPTAGYLGTISISRSSIFDDPTLRPERTQSSELGLEFKFFKNRLYMDFTWYKANTFDQIVNAPVDPSTGFSYVRTNIGEISNTGFELLIGGTPVQSNNFLWDISFNMAKNTNVLESFIEGTDSYLFTNYQNFFVKTKVGGEIGDIYGRDFLYHEGKMVVDENGLPVNSEEKLLGNYQPDLTGGLYNTFSYKNLELSFLIEIRVGGETYSQTERELKSFGIVKSTLDYRDGVTLDAVVNTGTEDAPVYEPNTTEISGQGYYSRLYGIEGAHIYDLSNARLRELTLTYNFPQRWMDNCFLSRASLSFVGRNLFFFYKYVDADPDTSISTGNNGQGALYYNLPTTRNLGFNLNISF